MQYKPGDQVDFLDMEGSGVVSRIEGDTIFVQDDSGFEYPCMAGDIILRKPNADLFLTFENPELNTRISDDLESGSVRKKLRRSESGAERDAIHEIDLHIHELLDSNANLSNYEMVKIQMAHFTRMMDLAYEQRIAKLVFIHGVGKGILKQEIIQALQFFPDCEYRDADFRLYGQGATEVNIRFH